MNSFALYARSSVLMLVALMNDDQTHTKRRGKKKLLFGQRKTKTPQRGRNSLLCDVFSKKKKSVSRPVGVTEQTKPFENMKKKN